MNDSKEKVIDKDYGYTWTTTKTVYIWKEDRKGEKTVYKWRKITEGEEMVTEYKPSDSNAYGVIQKHWHTCDSDFQDESRLEDEKCS